MDLITYEQYLNEVVIYPFDLSELEQAYGFTATSTIWTSETDLVTIGSPTLNSSIAKCSITANKVGRALIRVIINTSTADSRRHFFYINIIDPEAHL